ncbi:heavy metal-associated isoprenylated plant protein 3-like [Diospyros lotus]|uniref:heavy metal-associated isoprenylated plant protein 3-like n=1 Tax=Diospyros lotus TaxID=55363 RepID=UPI0022574F1F|nr:heavy metal-associated isoprenylated plant protein 3-like [Diospyros lotus]
MGEQEAPKNEGEVKKADGGAGKKDEGPAPVVLKVDLHCEGCAKKVKRAVRHFDGVEEVQVDMASNKLTVTGKVDAEKVRQRVEERIHKKAEIISQPKKDAAGGDKKPDEKSEKKPDEKLEKKPEDNKPKAPPVSTVVMKIRLHCDGCMNKIKRITKKFNGVQSVTMDGQKDLVTVTGTMDVNQFIPYLKEKLKRSVDVVPPKKPEGDGGEKKEKGGGGGGDKKEKEGEGGGKKQEGGGGGGGEPKPAKTADSGDGKKSEESKVEVKKLEYQGQASTSFYTPPMMNPGYINQGYGAPMYNQSYFHPMMYHQQGYADPSYSQVQGHPNPGYMLENSYPGAYQPYPPPSYIHAPQMFSDENPNACSVM